MLKTRARRRYVGWLSLAVMLLAACLPLLTQARLAATGAVEWLEVCSASGAVWVRAVAVDTADEDAAADASGQPASDHADADCPWCGAAGTTFSTPQIQLAWTLPSLRVSRPRAAGPALHLAALWEPAVSRAPPAHL